MKWFETSYANNASIDLDEFWVEQLEKSQPDLKRRVDRTVKQWNNTIRDLIRNSLRMRPDRIVVGECRDGAALDMLAAMNTGHDGSMGTLHANSPREALSRLESMITMGGFSLPAKTIREMITGSVDIIVQAARLRDGSRRITKITEVIGMEGDVITTQELFLYEFTGEDADGNLLGQFRPTGMRPNFIDKAKYYNLDRALMEALQEPKNDS